MRRRGGTALAVTLSIGLFPHCDNVSPAETATAEAVAAPRFERSGTRLEARGWEADGFFVFDTFFDTKLGIECVPGIASDNVRRCLPRNVYRKLPKIGSTPPQYFEAPDCKDGRLIEVWKGEGRCTDPARIVAVGFGSASDYERIGEPRTPASELNTIYSGKSCSETIAPPEYEFFAPGAPIAATDLVAFTVREVDVAPGLRALVLDGEDGSRYPQGDFVNVARGQPCHLGLAADDVKRCVPSAGSYRSSEAFVDEACTSHAAIPLNELPRDDGSACTLGPCDDRAVTTGAWPSAANPCAEKVAYHERGPERPIVRYTRAGSAPCEPASSDSDQGFSSFAIGEEIDPKTLPKATDGVTTHARLEERTVIVGGVSVQRVSIVDPTLDDEECTFVTAADGKPRCLPVNGLLAQRPHPNRSLSPLYYEDEGCTQRLYFPPTDPGEYYFPFGARTQCGREARFAHVVEGSPCAPVVRIHDVRPATAAFTKDDAGRCVTASGVLDGELKGSVFALADEVPAARFAEGTAVTR
ncbi:MAG: hypothetical protein BGO98_42070 [Myxococcales bacterium 68-20]|nr:hypothetical protein [Myxococcales bacterium]OJY27842.1 MAG: hypothetical protein BGO98_42070 [Myxococcales bacterium 68-20]